jgi:D-xylose transport system permease protein
MIPLSADKPVVAKTTFRVDLQAYAMVAALLVIWTFFTFMTNQQFLTARNLSNLSVQMAVTAILATGMVLVMVAGHIDLSVGSLMGLTGGLAAILEVWAGWPTWAALGGALLFGLLVGLLQGWFVAYQKIPAFIVTLGGMMAFRGVLLGISKGITVSGLSSPFKLLGQGFLPKPVGLVLAGLSIMVVLYMLTRQRVSRKRYGFAVTSMPRFALTFLFYSALIVAFTLVMTAYQGIPVPILIVVALVAIYTFMANRTRFGRHVFAMGGNVEAARFSGINVKRTTMLVFVLNGLLVGVASLVLTGRLSAATISAGGGYELDAIAACVIGGTSTMGGRGSVTGAILGALVMASLDNGMSMMNTDAFWQQIVKGLVLVLAVWMDVATKGRGAKA